MTRLWLPSHLMGSEKASELYCNEVLAGDGEILEVDVMGSMRGMSRDRDFCVQHGYKITMFSEGDPHGT